jgi:hypothetical protein
VCQNATLVAANVKLLTKDLTTLATVYQNEMVLVTVMPGESAKAEKAVFEKFELLERRHLGMAGLGTMIDLPQRRIWVTTTCRWQVTGSTLGMPRPVVEDSCSGADIFLEEVSLSVKEPGTIYSSGRDVEVLWRGDVMREALDCQLFELENGCY